MKVKILSGTTSFDVEKDMESFMEKDIKVHGIQATTCSGNQNAIYTLYIFYDYIGIPVSSDPDQMN